MEKSNNLNLKRREKEQRVNILNPCQIIRTSPAAGEVASLRRIQADMDRRESRKRNRLSTLSSVVSHRNRANDVFFYHATGSQAILHLGRRGIYNKNRTYMWDPQNDVALNRQLRTITVEDALSHFEFSRYITFVRT